MTKTYYIDNSRPDDPDYPNFKPAPFRKSNLLVNEGQYIVDRDGDIRIATTSNNVEYPNDFLRGINEGFFRAKYIGNKDDSLDYANQCRLATLKEIAAAQEYDPGGVVKITSEGQALLL